MCILSWAYVPVGAWLLLSLAVCYLRSGFLPVVVSWVFWCWFPLSVLCCVAGLLYALLCPRLGLGLVSLFALSLGAQPCWCVILVGGLWLFCAFLSIWLVASLLLSFSCFLSPPHTVIVCCCHAGASSLSWSYWLLSIKNALDRVLLCFFGTPRACTILLLSFYEDLLLFNLQYSLLKVLSIARILYLH